MRNVHGDRNDGRTDFAESPGHEVKQQKVVAVDLAVDDRRGPYVNVDDRLPSRMAVVVDEKDAVAVHRLLAWHMREDGMRMVAEGVRSRHMVTVEQDYLANSRVDSQGADSLAELERDRKAAQRQCAGELARTENRASGCE